MVSKSKKCCSSLIGGKEASFDTCLLGLKKSKRVAVKGQKSHMQLQSRRLPTPGLGGFVWASGSGRREDCGSRQKISGREERKMRLIRACGPSELIQVATGSAMKGWETKK